MSRLSAAIYALGQRFGYDLIGQRSVAKFLQHRAIDLVIDAGANRGQYARYLRRTGYAGSILSIEPAGEAFAALQARAASEPKWEVLQLALGAENGEIELNLSERPVFSSIKPLSPLAEAFDPGTRYVGTERVPLRRLDSISEAQNEGRIFIKVDVQGYEREVIVGAKGLLDRVHGVQLELPVEHLYDGVWSLPQAIEAMADLGFALAQVRPVSMLHDDPVSAIEFDCLFRRNR